METDKFLKGGIDALLLKSFPAIMRACGYDGDDCRLLITKKDAYLITDRRYEGRAMRLKDMLCVIMGGDDDIKRIVSQQNIKTLGFEEKETTVFEYSALSALLPDVKLTPASNIMEEMRILKNPDEIALMQASQDRCDYIFSEILKKIPQGLTELQIKILMDDMMYEAGMIPSFDTMVLSGSETAIPHGVPRDVKIEKGFVLMDFGASYKGYKSDMTRTVYLGDPSDEEISLYNLVLKAHNAGLACLAPGASCFDADKASRDALGDYAKFYTHSLGHGVGLCIHELPNLSPKSTAYLQKGHIVTCEPGIYMQGKFGIRIEDMVEITDTGYRSFAHSPKELICL